MALPAAAALKMVSLLLLMITVISSASSAGPVSAPSPSPYSGLMPMAPGSAASAPMPGMDCTNAYLNMSQCLTYVEEGSNQTVPDTGCCPGLSDLINNQPACLCKLLATGSAFGVKIDTTKALMLPNVCKLQAPPVSLCAVLGIPVSSPTGPSPAPTSGGAEEPVSSPMEKPSSAAPIAAPPVGNTSSSSRAAFSLLAVIGLSIICAIF